MNKFVSKVKKLIHNKREADDKESVSKDIKVNNIKTENNDDLDNVSLFSAEQEEAVPSSDEEEEEFNLFPKPIVVDNGLSVNSTAVPCSYNDNAHQSHHTQPINYMNGYATQYNNSFISDNNNHSQTNNMLFSNIAPTNSHNKYFNNGMQFNNSSYPSTKSIFSPPSMRVLPNDDHMITPNYAGTPQMIPPSISSFNNHNSNVLKHENSPNIAANNDVSPVSSNGNGTDVLPENFHLPEGVNYVCHYCDASFQVRGYLSRHIKKHAIVKEYTCPYYRHLSETKNFMEHNLKNNYYKSKEEMDDARKKYQSMNHVCHNHNGEFWRKDTLMIHLKKKHYSVDRHTLKHVLEQKKIEQGPGVKSKPKVDGTKLPGTCTCCNERFANADDFCNNHVLDGSCAALPNGYSIKTNLDDEDEKKQNSKCVLKLIKFSNNDARFIFTKSAVVEPEVFSNREVIDLIVDMAEKKTPMSNINTPAFGDTNKLTSTFSGGSILSPQSSHSKYSPMPQSLGMNKMNNISPSSSNSNGPLSHFSGDDTPIVEKLNDNRIVIHPDQVVPIDANKKRKKRRSKKEMEAYREKLAKEKMEKEGIKLNSKVNDNRMAPVSDQGRIDISSLLNNNQPAQLQLLMQMYQQQRQIQVNNGMHQRPENEYPKHVDEDYPALDDDHYSGHNNEYSPTSNKSNTTANMTPPNLHQRRRSGSSGSQKTYSNKDLNTGYIMSLQKYAVNTKVQNDCEDEGLSMDGGF